MNPQSINQKLNLEYFDFVEKLKVSVLDIPHENMENISCPLIPYVFSDYFKAQKKIVFIGKETHGWGFLKDFLDCGTDDMVQIIRGWYLNFDFGKDIRNKRIRFNSAFWRFFHNLYGKINNLTPEQAWGHSRGFVWLNMSRIDESGTTPSNVVLDKTFELSVEILQKELIILQPDIIIILGFDYWWRFKKINNFIAKSIGDDKFSEKVYEIECEAFPIDSKVFWVKHPERKKLVELESIQNAILKQLSIP